jgi:hypothetical protein
MNARWLGAGLLGVALGTSYVASPLTIWFVVVMTGVFAWAGRGLGRRERQYVFGVLALGVGLRVVALAWLFLVSDPNQVMSFSWDGDGVYLKYRAMVIRNVWMGTQVSPADWFGAVMPYYGWSSYIEVLAYLQYLTGSAPYGVHLLNVSMFVAAAVMMHKLIRPAFGRSPAFLGLTLMLFLPTLVAWSVSALKESLLVLLFAAGLRAIVTAGRAAHLYQRVLALGVLVGVLASGNSVRVGMSLIMALGFSAGVAGSGVVRRGLLAVLLVVCLPLAAVGLWAQPAVQEPVMSQLRLAATQHRANFLTKGTSYQLLERRFYADNYDMATMTPEEGLRFVARAITSFILMPLPWQVPRGLGSVFLVQQLVWYILVCLACVGLVAGLRRDALVTCLLVGLSLAGSLAIALNNGNVGTLVRFRDLIVPLVVWLSALGATSAMSRVMAHVAVSTAGGPAFVKERDVTH